MLTTLPLYVLVTIILQLTTQEINGNNFQCYCNKNGVQTNQQQSQQSNQQQCQRQNEGQQQQQNRQVYVPVPVPANNPPSNNNQNSGKFQCYCGNDGSQRWRGQGPSHNGAQSNQWQGQQQGSSQDGAQSNQKQWQGQGAAIAGAAVVGAAVVGAQSNQWQGQQQGPSYDGAQSDQKQWQGQGAALAGAAVVGAAIVGAQSNQRQGQGQGQGRSDVPGPTHRSPSNNNNNNNNDDDDDCPPKCNYCIRDKCNPGSCKPAPNFNATADAERLQHAVVGAGTDEHTLIDILTRRSDRQIEAIRQEYVRCGRTLRSDIDGDTSMKTKDLMRALMTPRPLFYAEQLNKAFKKGDSDTLIEILCSLSDCAIREVSSEYEKTFHKSLPESIDKKTCGDFEDFLKELAKGNRNTDQRVDVEQAKKDADALINGGVKKWLGTDEQKFIDIFAQRSWPQLREVLKQYDAKRSPGIEKDISSETSGKLEKGLLTLVRTARDQNKYLAGELGHALDSVVLPVPGDNDKLIRVMRGRCGVDLGDVRDAFPGGRLEDRLSSKTYMDYEAALLAMIKD